MFTIIILLLSFINQLGLNQTLNTHLNKILFWNFFSSIWDFWFRVTEHNGPAGCCSDLLLMTILLRSLLFSAKTLRELSTLLFTCDYNLCTLISSEKIPQWSSGKSDHQIVINSDHRHQEIHKSPRVGHPVEACLLLFDLRSSSLQVSYQCVKILLFANIDKEKKQFTHFCDFLEEEMFVLLRGSILPVCWMCSNLTVSKSRDSLRK